MAPGPALAQGSTIADDQRELVLGARFQVVGLELPESTAGVGALARDALIADEHRRDTIEGPVGRILLEIAGALACFILLLRRQAGHSAPMLAADLLKRPLFALLALIAVCSFAAQGLAFVSLPFLSQQTLGRSPCLRHVGTRGRNSCNF